MMSTESTKKPIWQPKPESIQKANLTHFMTYVREQYKVELFSFEALHQWSIQNIRDFWRAVWDFCGVIAKHKGKREVSLPHSIFKPQFFTDAQLNFAENLLRQRPK